MLLMCYSTDRNFCDVNWSAMLGCFNKIYCYHDQKWVVYSTGLNYCIVELVIVHRTMCDSGTTAYSVHSTAWQCCESSKYKMSYTSSSISYGGKWWEGGRGGCLCAQRTVVVWEPITFRKCVKTNKHTKSAFLSPLKMKAFLNQHRPLSDLLMKRHVLVGI